MVSVPWKDRSTLTSLPPVRDLLKIGALLCLLSFAAIRLETGSSGFQGITVLWPSNALLLGVLLCRPRRQWPALVLLAYSIDVSVNLLQHDAFTAAAYLSTCNMLEALLPAFLLYSEGSPYPDLTERKQLLKFLAYAVVVSPSIASFLASIAQSGHFTLSGLHSFYGWFVGDALGMATVAPLYLAFQRKRIFGGRPWWEITLLFTMLTAGVFTVFWQTSFPVLFVVLPLLLLVGIRLRLTGSAVGLAIVAILGGFLSTRGHGPFALMRSSPLFERDLIFQFFVASSMLMLYLVEVMISESERLRDHLEGSERRFRLLAEASSDMIATREMNGKLSYISPVVTRLLGWTPEEILGGKVGAIWHPDDVTALEQLFRECGEGRTVAPLECRCRKTDGSYLWVEINTRLYYDTHSGLPAGFVSAARDISIRKVEQEQKQRAFEIMQQANQSLTEARTVALQATEEKSRFLSNMSHEIRTPMNGVVGMVQLLLTTELTEEQHRYAAVAHSSGLALLTLVDEILDLSKIEAGKIVLETLDFDLPEAIRHLAEIWRLQAERRNLTFASEVASDTPRFVRGDPNRLRQILMNLASNAIKFTEQGGVELKVSSRDDMDGRSTIRFAFKDTGIGIPADRIPTLFSPFVQADLTTTRKYGGTGLGLSICKSLVELMGGTIGIESQSGQGSTFWFTAVLEPIEEPLSLDESATLNQHRQTPHALSVTPGIAHVLDADGREVRILVAEDNATNREVILAQLGKLGYRADAVVDGAEAVETVLQGNYQLVLMDCEMPLMDGYEATRLIRESGSRIPIVALTANAMLGHRERCLAAGMNDVMTKPVDLQFLSEIVARWRPGKESPPELQPGEPAQPEQCAPVFDAESFLKRLMDDRELAGILIQGFLGDFPSQWRGLQDRFAEADAPGAHRHAHTLKGSSATVSACALSAVASTLEQLAESGDMDSFGRLLPSALDEFERFETELDRAGWL